MPDTSWINREWVYAQRPREYEMSGCPTCGNEDPDWSEFQHRLWCPKCQVDFVPESSGLFDGPVPVNIAQMLGFDLRRIILATGEVQEFPWPDIAAITDSADGRGRERG